MSNLIAANFSQLFKNKLFYVIIVIFTGMAVYSIIFDFMYFSSTRDAILYLKENNLPLYEPNMYADAFMRAEFTPYLVVSAIFISLFIGKEFGHNTIRNKIAAGNTRTNIYLSNLIVCVSAELIIHIIYCLTLFILLFILFLMYKANNIDYPMFYNSFFENVVVQIAGLGILILYASIYLFFVMISASRTRSAEASLIFVAMMIILSMYVSENLYQYEPYHPTSSTATADTPTDASSNIVDDYDLYYGYDSYTEYHDSLRGKKLSGMKAWIYKTADDIIPIRQADYLMNCDTIPLRTNRYIIYDYGFSAVITALGIIIFNRKDIK